MLSKEHKGEVGGEGVIALKFLLPNFIEELIISLKTIKELIIDFFLGGRGTGKGAMFFNFLSTHFIEENGLSFKGTK